MAGKFLKVETLPLSAFKRKGRKIPRAVEVTVVPPMPLIFPRVITTLSRRETSLTIRRFAPVSTTYSTLSVSAMKQNGSSLRLGGGVLDVDSSVGESVGGRGVNFFMTSFIYLCCLVLSLEYSPGRIA